MMRLALCILALAASLLSGYLLWIHMAGQVAPLGCGGTEGCGQVLNGRWSYWLGIPVSAPGLSLYLAMFLAGCLGSPRQPLSRQRRAWSVLAGGSLLAAGAAGWFLSRQIVEGRYCRFCLAIHACGVLIAALVWFHLIAGRRIGPEGIGRKAVAGSVSSAILGLALLIWGQTAAPSTGIGHLLPRQDSAFEKRIGSLAGFELDDLPTIGPKQAKYRIVVLADYTCDHCRSAHQMLQQVRKRLPKNAAIVIVPMPLNAGCNPFVQRTDPRHQYACELARLALAVWRADPAKFADLEAYLFAVDIPATPADARRYAGTLVGEDALARAEKDPWVGQALTRSTNLYQSCGGGVLPKVLIGTRLIEGQPESPEALISAIQREWGADVIGKEAAR
ncbi:MAG: vitamin K epoxide reductase family protein [Tepidisphaerales bacterium]